MTSNVVVITRIANDVTIYRIIRTGLMSLIINPSIYNSYTYIFANVMYISSICWCWYRYGQCSALWKVDVEIQLQIGQYLYHYRSFYFIIIIVYDFYLWSVGNRPNSSLVVKIVCANSGPLTSCAECMPSWLNAAVASLIRVTW